MPAPSAAAQLLIYRFPPGADFEGRLVGAMERIESGGALKILEALFVASDPETREPVAIDLMGEGGAGIVAPLVSFRFEAAERERATKRAMDPNRGGLAPDTLRELGSALEPGAAIVAMLVDHAWARALEDAVSRTGGTALAREFVDAKRLAELGPDLLAAVARS
jgi:hypothetical protein